MAPYFRNTPSGYQGKHGKRRRRRWSVLKNETPATFVEEKFQLGATPNVLGEISPKKVL
jgi:hypothetical protein